MFRPGRPMHGDQAARTCNAPRLARAEILSHVQYNNIQMLAKQMPKVVCDCVMCDVRSSSLLNIRLSLRLRRARRDTAWCWDTAATALVASRRIEQLGLRDGLELGRLLHLHPGRSEGSARWSTRANLYGKQLRGCRRLRRPRLTP